MRTRFPSGVWAIVLIASVLVNGVVLGIVVAGAAMNVQVGRTQTAIVSAPSFRGFEDRLPEEVRDEVRTGLRERALEARPLLDEMVVANGQVVSALTAEPFDPEAARAAFERVREARSALEAQAHELTVSLFSNLPQETRERLIRRSGDGRMIVRGFGDGDGPGDRGRGDDERDWRFERRGPD